MAKGARDHETVQGFIRSPGNTDQQNVTAVANSLTVSFAGTTIELVIENQSGQFIQYSLDGGTTFSDINPYQFFQAAVAVDDVRIKRKSGSADAAVQIVATYGKA